MSTTTKIKICNNALLRLGADLIEALNEESKEAEYCNQLYDEVRQDVLDMHPWNCAMKQATLSKLATTPNDWSFEYILPNDVVAVRKVVDCANNENVQIKFEVRGNRLFTDQDEAIIEYTSDLEDTTRFSRSFASAIAWRLAAELAMPITNNPGIQDQMLRNAMIEMSKAERNDAREEMRDTRVGDSFLDARA